MGRLIDCNDVYNAIQITTDNFGVAKSIVENTMLTMLSKIDTAEAIPKAEYEARLKADMVAMLEDLDLQIDEIPIVTRHGITGTMMTAQGMRKKIKENIQQKIDALKEQTDGNDSK